MQNAIAKTLFIPLAARLYATQKFPEYFHDDVILRLREKIPENFMKISSEYEMLASAARYHETDLMIREFISAHGVCNVVNLGCGLETLAFRIDDGQAKVYGVDLPEVISFRVDSLPVHKNETLIAGDMFDMQWVERIQRDLPTIFVSNGVFMYFETAKILNFVADLKKNFNNAELVFDATTRWGIHCANFYVSRIDKDLAKMHFFVQNPEEFARRCDCKLVRFAHFFTTAREMLRKKTKFSTRLLMAFVDTFDLAFLLRLKIS